MDKSRCFDIFYETNIDGTPMYEQDSHERKLKYKFNRNNMQSELNTLKLLKSIGAFKGHFYVKALLRRIHLSKQLLIIELEQGLEIFIPRDFQQNELPNSFRYFDPILQIVQESISKERKQFFLLKLQFNLSHVRARDYKGRLLALLIGEDSKLHSKQHSINNRQVPAIDHTQSQHTLALQRSNYLTIEHD